MQSTVDSTSSTGATAVVPRPPRVRRRRTTEEQEGRAGYALIAPTTVLLAVFYLYPLVQTVGYSFTTWNPATGQTGDFVGLSNFTGLFQNDEFLRAAGNTGIYVLVVVPITMAIGLFFAALLAQPFRGRGVYRALLFVPYIAPIVGSALIFSFILSPLGGIVNGALTSLGVAPIGFLNSEPWALISVMVFSIWQGTGYAMIIFSAALTNIPQSYHEAATLDGAGPIRRFFSISLPLVVPTLGFLAITGVIGALQVFTQVYILTQGGPLQSTETILYFIYQQGFVFFHGGTASAAAVLLLIVGIVVSVIQLRVLNRRDTIELT
ncbi:Lactose transport system permease protein LacF [Frondihabitans sp. 762G35]|uniref:carbohydrate ABC transporter permease n=1 Tax=Frondihabitans sp. 762G35 TaxID=1446794 RepID=UPI000D21DCF8|nr:sugar ABC transporter permease [Frondihabitans sp. 762G35]ARC56260.1 Lactose transport system permease protein LacF [Frondihabitans sp. 762G35]